MHLVTIGRESVAPLWGPVLWSYDTLAGFATSTRYSDVVTLPNRRVLSRSTQSC